MKSSLKTFLKGKNRYNPKTARLKNAMSLHEATVEVLTTISFGSGAVFFIDVFDDGTAITYSPSP